MRLFTAASFKCEPWETVLINVAQEQNRGGGVSWSAVPTVDSSLSQDPLTYSLTNKDTGLRFSWRR